MISVAIISVLIILIPFIKNLYDINVDAEYWQSEKANGKRTTQWLDRYGKFVYILIFSTGTTYGSLELVNSNLFGVTMFSMGIAPPSFRRFVSIHNIYL